MPRGDRSAHPHRGVSGSFRGTVGYRGVSADDASDPAVVFPPRPVTVPASSTTPLTAGSDTIEAGGGGVTIDNGSDPPVAVSTLVAPTAVVDGEEATFRGVIVSPTEPTTSDAQFWLQNGPNGTSYQLYVRDEPNEDWLLASAGLGQANDDDGIEHADRQVGIWNANYGGVNGMEVQSATGLEVIRIRSISADGNTVAQITVGAGRVQIDFAAAVIFGSGVLPTSDPGVFGQLYTDGTPATGVPKAALVSGG
jgi:hypothetical protein